MASTVPAKSQTLHNFPLHRFNWNNNHPRGGRSPGGGGGACGGGGGRGGEGGEHKRHAKKHLENHDQKVEKSEKSKVLGGDHGIDIGSMEDKGIAKEPRSRILIKIPASMRNLGSNKEKEEEKKEENPVMIDEQKAWNLRPRRSVKKSLNGDDGSVGVGGGGGGGGFVQEKKKDQLVEGNLENGNNRGRVEKEKKVKFSMSLTRQEIEEDVYSLTGLKPSRRPKKRAKAIQKNLDIVFPGLWLGYITPDSYKVSEHSMKG